MYSIHHHQIRHRWFPSHLNPLQRFPCHFPTLSSKHWSAFWHCMFDVMCFNLNENTLCSACFCFKLCKRSTWDHFDTGPYWHKKGQCACYLRSSPCLHGKKWQIISKNIANKSSPFCDCMSLFPSPWIRMISPDLTRRMWRKWYFVNSRPGSCKIQ